TEKAYRSSGLPLSEPIRLGDMENMSKFPVCVFVFLQISDLKLDQLVYFPGNERHGIWSSKNLVTVYPPATPAARPDRGQAEKRPSTNGEGQKTASRDESRTR
ncbi:MAG: hypothetical protein JO034_26680, partial [Singulisphaera sp.]|nr:hypothetical protein [Singulisphaera sp.]